MSAATHRAAFAELIEQLRRGARKAVDSGSPHDQMEAFFEGWSNSAISRLVGRLCGVDENALYLALEEAHASIRNAPRSAT